MLTSLVCLAFLTLIKIEQGAVGAPIDSFQESDVTLETDNASLETTHPPRSIGPVQLLKRRIDGQLEVHPDFPKAMKQIEMSLEYWDIDAKLCLMPVVGPVHSGKSFLLNQLLREYEAVTPPRHRNGKRANRIQDYFKIGTSTRSETQGVWIMPFALPAQAFDGSTVYVLFLDTEGFFSPDRSNEYDSKVFSLLATMSCRMMFTTMRTIDDLTIDALEIMTWRTRLFGAAMSTNSNSQEVHSAEKSRFADLTWIVQNFVSSFEDSDTAEDWILKILSSHRHGRLESGNSTQTAGSLLPKMFSSVHCQTTSLPHYSPAELNNLEKVSQSDLLPTYKGEVQSVAQHVFSDIQTQISSEWRNISFTLTLEELASDFHTLVHGLNTDLYPAVQSSSQDYFSMRFHNILSEAGHVFDNCMEPRVHRVPLNQRAFLKAKDGCMSRALSSVQESLFGLVLPESEQQELNALLLKREENIAQENINLVHALIDDTMENMLKEYTDFLANLPTPSSSDALEERSSAFLEKLQQIEIEKLRNFRDFDTISESIHSAQDEFNQKVDGKFARYLQQNARQRDSKFEGIVKDASENFEILFEKLAQNPKIRSMEDFEALVNSYREEVEDFVLGELKGFGSDAKHFEMFRDDLNSRLQTTETQQELLASHQLNTYLKNQMTNVLFSFTQETGKLSLPLHPDYCSGRLEKTAERLLSGLDAKHPSLLESPEYKQARKELEIDIGQRMADSEELNHQTWALRETKKINELIDMNYKGLLDSNRMLLTVEGVKEQIKSRILKKRPTSALGSGQAGSDPKYEMLVEETVDESLEESALEVINWGNLALPRVAFNTLNQFVLAMEQLLSNILEKDCFVSDQGLGFFAKEFIVAMLRKIMEDGDNEMGNESLDLIADMIISSNWWKRTFPTKITSSFLDSSIFLEARDTVCEEVSIGLEMGLFPLETGLNDEVLLRFQNGVIFRQERALEECDAEAIKWTQNELVLPLTDIEIVEYADIEPIFDFDGPVFVLPPRSGSKRRPIERPPGHVSLPPVPKFLKDVLAKKQRDELIQLDHDLTHSGVAATLNYCASKHLKTIDIGRLPFLTAFGREVKSIHAALFPEYHELYEKYWVYSNFLEACRKMLEAAISDNIRSKLHEQTDLITSMKAKEELKQTLNYVDWIVGEILAGSTRFGGEFPRVEVAIGWTSTAVEREKVTAGLLCLLVAIAASKWFSTRA